MHSRNCKYYWDCGYEICGEVDCKDFEKTDGCEKFCANCGRELDIKKQFKEFYNLKTDVEKWKWVQKYQSNGVVVNLDNDYTFLTHPDCDGYLDFNGHIGNSDGVLDMLEAFGIRFDVV